MEKKKGFTLVELLGVIVVLAIVLGIATVAYIGINEGVDEAYYRSIEQSLRMAGADYFFYNKDAGPKVLGDQKTVTAKYLQENNYMQEEIKDKDGNICDLEKSVVGAYKNSTDSTEYYTCLSCGEYETNSDICLGKVEYSLSVRGNKEGENKIYKLDGSSWSDKNIVLTFETANDIDTVYVKGNGTTKQCRMQEKGVVRSCTITLDTTGSYTYYGEKETQKTSEKEIKVKIDKTAPTFDLDKTGTINIPTTTTSGVVSNIIKNIKDNESGIRTIEYSLEKDGSQDKYQKQDNTKTSIDISKTLERGDYRLKVRVVNNAGITSSVKEVVYSIYKRVAEPTSSKCTNNYYNGNYQYLTSSEGEGYTFYNNYQRDVGYSSYQIEARLKYGYRWNNDSKESKYISCNLKKVNLSLSLSSSSSTIYEGSSTGYTVYLTSSPSMGSVYGTLSNSVSYSSYASASPSSTSEYLSSRYVSVYGYYPGSTYITVSFTPSDTRNYNYPSSKSFYLTVLQEPVVTPDPPTPPDPPSPTIVSYTILHQVQEDTGGYTTKYTETGTGYVGDTVTATLQNFGSNYTTPSSYTFTLRSSGNTFYVKYNKSATNYCKGSFCDYCEYGSNLGQCLYDKRNTIGLWESGLDGDSYTVRFTGKTPNNYIKFGSGTHRIIGAFDYDHSVRIIRTDYSTATTWSSSASKLYPDSNLRTVVESQPSLLYNSILQGSTRYSSLIQTSTRGILRGEGMNDVDKALHKKDGQFLLQIETNRAPYTIESYSAQVFPIAISDVILATRQSNLTFYDNYSTIKSNSWLVGSSIEWTFQRWNTVNSFLIHPDGKLCANSNNVAHKTNCSGVSAHYSKSYNYRLNFNLDSSVLFCGGSATSSDPIKIGYGSCPN